MKTITKILFYNYNHGNCYNPLSIHCRSLRFTLPCWIFYKIFFVIGLGIWFLGWTQLLLMIIWIILIFLIW